MAHYSLLDERGEHEVQVLYWINEAHNSFSSFLPTVNFVMLPAKTLSNTNPPPFVFL